MGEEVWDWRIGLGLRVQGCDSVFRVGVGCSGLGLGVEVWDYAYW